MDTSIALTLKGVTKAFVGSVVACDHVDLSIRHGEILAILGENGCCKTTLMNMIAGIYYPDAGQIFVDGEEVLIRSPKEAFSYKIGMIHQHFKLVDVFTAAQNIVLGVDDGTKYNIAEVNRRVSENCGLNPDEWSGLAFGAGLDRIAMLKYGINNIHILYDGDQSILRQFRK